MAFVFSGPRFALYQNCQTPGPGSHCPDLIQSSRNTNSATSLKNCLRKGKAFVKALPNQQNMLTPTPINEIATPTSIETVAPEKSRKVLNCIKNYDLSNFETYSNSHNSNPQNNFIEISSLQRGVFLEDLKKQASFKMKDQIFEGKFQNIDLKKTVASIKQVYQQKFYIGSKDDFLKKNSKKHPPTKAQLNNRMKLNLNWQEAQKKESNVSQGKPQRTKKFKPISAKHPFRRNQNLYQDSEKYQEKSTRIHQEEQETQISEFIDDAVPGPGTYEVNRIAQTTKKCPLYTQTNKARFQEKVNQNNIVQVPTYNYQLKTKKSKSRASQRKVGFGRSLTHKSITITAKKLQDIDQPPLFYDNSKSIENNCIRLKLKDALNPGFFISKVQRFPQVDKKLVFNANRDELAQDEHLKEMKKEFIHHKFTHPFSSTVKREKIAPPLTADVEYSGQDYKTIENDLKHVLSQPKYFDEGETQELDFQTEIQNTQALDIPVFKHIKSQIQIKHHLIENIYGFRQREKKLNKKQIKGYTFATNQADPTNKENSPDPTKYHTELKWVKNNFNMRFQQRNDKKVQVPIFQEYYQEDDVDSLLDNALQIVKI